MIIVGEQINTSRKSIAQAVERKDRRFIQSVARQQAEAGANYIDVNAGTFLDQEVECLSWLVETVQAEVDLPLCLDSPNPKALEKALEIHRGQAMINSISLEKERYEALLPVIAGQPCKVVALCVARTAMPTTVQERVDVAAQLIDGLTRAGVDPRHIFVDPLVQPVSVDVRMGPVALEAIGSIMKRFVGVQTICGLSNISFGLPLRRQINRHFLVLAMARGLSAAILDPTDQELMASLVTTQMLLGQDEYCSAFIEAYESGLSAQET
jgi:cobalamin-dependent methionine synthase I